MSSNISVILPNYNHSRFLQQRIDSILNQTYQDFELILIDDCSTDNSRDILESYRGNEHVSHIVFNEKNTGMPFQQWNKGIELATGRWIWIAESDDWCESDFLESLVSLVGNREDVSVAFTNSVFEYPEESKIGYSFSTEASIYDGLDFIKNHMLYDQVIYNASSAIFRKDFLRGIDDNYKSFKVAGDKLFWIMLCEKGNVAYIPKALNHFRKHGEEVSGPKAYRSGLVFEEELAILKRNSKQRYFSLPDKARVVDYYLGCIDEYYPVGSQLHDDLYSKWKKEAVNPLVLKGYNCFKRIKSLFS